MSKKMTKKEWNTFTGILNKNAVTRPELQAIYGCAEHNQRDIKLAKFTWKEWDTLISLGRKILKEV